MRTPAAFAVLRAITRSRSITAGIFVIGCLAITGCAAPGTNRTVGVSNQANPTNFWQPELLYLLDSPSPRLYVEVDAVAGSEPSESNLAALQDFLAAHCQKPGGIKIVRSDVIPRNDARGLLPEALAHKFLNGPPDDATWPPSAFLYVLFYDDKLCDEPATPASNSPPASTGHRSYTRLKNPHVDQLPYPAMIFMNTRYGPSSMRKWALLHEAGHIMGLVSRQEFASDHHCQDTRCLMNHAIRYHIGALLLGRNPITQKQLCERCQTELQQSLKLRPPPNLRFVGPVLVRSEAGYHVLSLPNRAELVLGNLADEDCGNFAAAVRAESPVPVEEDELQLTALFNTESLGGPEQVNEVMCRAAEDPYQSLRLVLIQACLKKGLYTNAVNIYRQAIAADPKDDWGYDGLAWLRATCSDGAMRDGRQAVPAAAKACELTAWKNWVRIDTLGAAYAEQGDFKRAIECVERALRTGHPADSDRQKMQARLSLYRQSQPFRDQP